MAITIQDVARASGLSLPTVSRVLSGSKYPIHDDTRQRVLDAAAQLGYQPNLAARGLRTKRTSTVGIVVDDIMSAFVPPIVRGIQDRLAESNYSGLLVNADWNPEMEHANVVGLLSRPVDGILFVEYSHLALDEALQSAGKPYFFVHRLFGTPIANSVVPDDVYGAMLAVDHLISLGHRKIGLISGPAGWHSARGRVDGYRRSLERHAIAYEPELVEYGDWEPESGYQATRTLLSLPEPPTAIFAANDLMALGAFYAAQDHSISVPGDVAIVGYDNREFGSLVRPRLTTVTMPVYDMGRAAADLLLTQIQDGSGPTDEVQVKGELIVRESCGAPPSWRTAELPRSPTMLRRLLLNRQPDA